MKQAQDVEEGSLQFGREHRHLFTVTKADGARKNGSLQNIQSLARHPYDVMFQSFKSSVLDRSLTTKLSRIEKPAGE